jgi:hypothetical protein
MDTHWLVLRDIMIASIRACRCSDISPADKHFDKHFSKLKFETGRDQTLP